MAHNSANVNATLKKKEPPMRNDFDQFFDGNAHFVEITKHTPDEDITRTYALIPVNLMSEKEIDRVMRIRQMNYPDKRA
jgi:hypothetical protein